MKLQFIFLGAVLTLLNACSKKTADAPITTVPERLEIIPESESAPIGGTIAFAVVYYNTSGDEAPAPSGIVWSTGDAAIATINAQGTATGISAGQTEIKAKYKNITAMALFTVVSNSNAVAIVTINPGEKELKLNETFILNAIAKDINGNTITGKTFAWETDAAAYADVNTITGDVTATGYGTANITATTDGIRSSPVMIQVIRTGNFSQMSSTGSAKLKIENGLLKLQTSADFSVSTGPPDLRIYLGNNSDNINGADEIASLNDRSGMQSWNVPASVDITQYRYVIVWCKQFGGVYGLADLGN
jgi:Electron transfer DM13